MTIKEKAAEIEKAAESMLPIEDLHIGRELRKLAEEIEHAAETMLPIQDLHLGKTLKKMADEVEQAQEAMFSLPVSEKEQLRILVKSALDSHEQPVIICDFDKKIRYANAAAHNMYAVGDIELVGMDAEDVGVQLKDLADENGKLIGYRNA